MSGVCQAYVIDASAPEDRAVNIGIFQGLSVAGAFILGFPISAILSAQYGLRAPLYAAAAVGFVNFLIVVFLTPESLPASQRVGKKLDLAQVIAICTQSACNHAICMHTASPCITS